MEAHRKIPIFSYTLVLLIIQLSLVIKIIDVVAEI